MVFLPNHGELALGEAEAFAGEIGTAGHVGHGETAHLDHELEPVGAGDRVPADPVVAVLEAFGCATPTKDGHQSATALLWGVLVGALPQHVAGGCRH